MPALRVTLCFLLTVSAVARAQRPTVDKQEAEREVLTAIRARLDAVAHNDVKTWAHYVADEMLSPLEGEVRSKQAWIESHENWPSAVKYYYGPLEDAKVRIHGDTAVVTFRAKQYNDVGGQIRYFQSWQIETHIRRGSHWLLVALADAPILSEPATAKVDPKIYDAYVGEYEYAPDLIAKVRRVGNKLMHELPGFGQEELLPENDTTFFIKGEAAAGSSRTIFVCDPNGRVTHYIYRELGTTDRIVKKIK
jgi:hypothetical protein